MDFPKSSPFLLSLVLCMTWLCVSTIPARGKNPLHDRYMPTMGSLKHLAASLPLYFAPGLLKILTKSTPPTVKDLKRMVHRTNKILRDHLKSVWVMYLVIFEKPGCRSKIYVGTGTKTQGARVRLRHYETGENLSRNVRRALAQGYKITHKFCLCWAPIPSAAHRPMFRAVFLALEAAFSFMFWAYDTKKDYTMPQMLLWPIETFEYDGLCSHIALSEGIPGDHDLSPEERVAHEAEMEHRQKLLKQKSHRKIKAADPVAFRAKGAAVMRRLRKKNPDRIKANIKRHRAKNVVEKKYHCPICDAAFPDKSKLTRHNNTKKHRERAGFLDFMGISDIQSS